MAETTATILAKWTPPALDNYASMTSPQKLAAARQMTITEKVMLGSLLFDRDCELVTHQIRETFPDAGDEIACSMVREYVRRKYTEE